MPEIDAEGAQYRPFDDNRPECEWLTCQKKACLVLTEEGKTHYYCVFHYNEKTGGSSCGFDPVA